MSALPEIVEQQGGKHDAEPAQSDGLRAEMSEVGIHRLAACNDEHHRAEDHQRFARPGAQQERDAEQRD